MGWLKANWLVLACTALIVVVQVIASLWSEANERGRHHAAEGLFGRVVEIDHDIQHLGAIAKSTDTKLGQANLDLMRAGCIPLRE